VRGSRGASPARSCQEDHQLRAKLSRRSWRLLPSLRSSREARLAEVSVRARELPRRQDRHHARRMHGGLVGARAVRHRRHRDDRAAIHRWPVHGIARARLATASPPCAGIRSGKPNSFAVEVAGARLHGSTEHGDREKQPEGLDEKGTRQPSVSPACSKHQHHAPYPSISTRQRPRSYGRPRAGPTDTGYGPDRTPQQAFTEETKERLPVAGATLRKRAPRASRGVKDRRRARRGRRPSAGRIVPTPVSR
jgi:hypothetical protein